ncbi:N-acyl homoserine lactonase family protein [Paracoccus sp. (in: a-proteobacteria)]|uniref:N-acyl homoserine lactonase family protein n=1 Tax=Paracoccus sp. TaxID=267 RepID=UPI0028A932D2|nr:N-acyl homoserine lactonase family protein [Paracoccus sp. (in: a-proteobacteria)]
MTEITPFELFAIRYASHDRPRSANFINGDPHDGPMPLDYYVWVAKRGEEVYLVDTGFDAATAEARGRKLLIPVEEGLACLGIKAGAVRDVIVTHLHYDHIGNFALFTGASFHLQEVEMAYATGKHMRHARLRHPFEAGHVAGMVHALYQDRVIFHDGNSHVAPGLSVHLIGGHSRGLQCVRVLTRRGWVVLASDCSHHYEHFHTMRPFPNVVRIDDMLDGYVRLRELADSPDHIIPGHDPLVLKIYPPAAEELAGHIVRLDQGPLPVTETEKTNS